MSIIPGKFHYGTGYPAERLPEGWELVEAPDDFAQAIDDKGNRYILSEAKAYPYRLAERDLHRRHGMILRGERWVDTDHPIELTIKPDGISHSKRKSRDT